MEFKYEVLRHVTNKRFLYSIINEGKLSDEFLLGKKDRSHISFESNPKTNTLVENFHILKQELGWKKNDIFELQFDAKKLHENGYKILNNIEGKYYSKVELDIVIDHKVSHLVGDYVFIKGEVPLKYLTDESKSNLLNWINGLEEQLLRYV